MCSQFTLKSPLSKIMKDLDIEWRGKELAPPEPTVLPHTDSPVVLCENGNITARLMRFSLLPSWSKEPKLKFASHNARLDSVDTKPAWKHSLLLRRCLVPMDEFVEPIYTGDYAGNLVAFRRKDGRSLYAAGIFDRWSDGTSAAPTESFAIITDEADTFVAKIGHDRQPLFLSGESAREWLKCSGLSGRDLRELLGRNRENPDLDVRIERPMNPGWEKRLQKKG